MNKFIKVDAWNPQFTESFQEIINVNKVRSVIPLGAYREKDCSIDGVVMITRQCNLFLKMSIDECLEMLNGAKDE